jgi:hypothetical protein
MIGHLEKERYLKRAKLYVFCLQGRQMNFSIVPTGMIPMFSALLTNHRSHNPKTHKPEPRLPQRP